MTCDGTGLEAVTSCPQKQITPDIWALLKSVGMQRRGMGWPAVGGWMDQADTLIEGIREVEECEALIDEQMRKQNANG